MGTTARRFTAVLLVVSLAVGIIPATAAVCYAAADFIPPVRGEVVRRFEEPLGPFAAGHRGIDYGVDAGTEVVASASGQVVFAGPVADDGLFVTLDHGVIRTTYSFLSEVGVEVGERVSQGERIGRSGDGHPGEGEPVLHFGAKVGDKYIDPEILLFGNLDDISDLISLAPIDDEFDTPPGGSASFTGSGPSAQLDEMRPPSLSTSAPGSGWFVAAGEKIGGAFAAAGRGITAGAKWAWNQRAGGVRLVGDGLRAAGEGLAAAADRAGRFFGTLGRKAESAWSKVVDWSAGVSRSVGRAVATGAKALSKAIGWAGRVLGAGLSKIVRAVGDALRMVRKQIGRLLGTAAKRILLLKHLGTFVFGMVKGGVEQVRCSRAGGATPPDLPTPEEMAAGTKAPSPPNDNIVIAVAGIGSSSSEVEGRVVGNASIYQMDFRTLGYSDEKIFHFSYKGLEDRSGAGPYRLHATYTKEDTYKSIVESARQLREQVSAIHGRYPNKQIDLIAHSQGGLVAQYFLTWFYRESNPDDLRIDHFISLASPHFGADAAGLHSALSDNVQGRITLWELNEVARRLGLPPPSSRAAQQLARDSDFIEDLTRSWNPQRVKATTISPTLDWVVAAPHTRLRGAAHYTADLPNMGSILFDHGGFVSTESAKGILYNALADSPSTCTALRNAFADYGPGRLVAEMEGTLVDALDIASHISPAGNIP